MTKIIPAIATAALLASTAAFAQTTAPSTTTPSQSAPPATTANPPPMIEKMQAPAGANSLKLTDAEAKAWINKAVYSSDNKRVGEVSAVQRDSSGLVAELHADIGGFLGIGETRIRLMPSDFKFGTDRVILNVTADKAKTLPAMPK